MLRSLAIILCVFIAGISIGYIINHKQEQERQNSLIVAIQALDADIAALERDLNLVSLSYTQLEDENSRLSELASMEAQASGERQDILPEPIGTHVAVRDDKESISRKKNYAKKPLSENDLLAAIEKRNNYQNNTFDRLDSQWEDADNETKERITVIAELQDTLFQLEEQMEREESVEAITTHKTTYVETLDAMQTINRIQQDYMLNNLARENGLSEEQTSNFARNIHELLNDPLFDLGRESVRSVK